MRVESVGSTAASSARTEMLEVWRMSMTSRLSREMRERTAGHREPNSPPVRVDPAVRVEITAKAKTLTQGE